MSDYAYVADKAKKAFASLSSLERAVARAPSDKGLQINLMSVRRFAEQARQEMERLAALNFIDVCQYRLVPEENSYGLEHVAKSFLSYQYLFSQIYDSVKNGPKSRASLGKEAEIESTLEFAYTYSGSLGVVLLAGNDRTFFEGKLDKPIESLYRIMEIGGVSDVRDVAHSMGRAVVKRVHDWSDANAKAKFSTDIRWNRSDGRKLGQMVDHRKLEKIVGYIESTSDEKVSKIRVTGILVGASLSSKSFHLVVPNGESYAGKFSLDFSYSGELTLGKHYESEILMSDVYHYATDKHDITYNIEKLTSVQV